MLDLALVAGLPVRSSSLRVLGARPSEDIRQAVVSLVTRVLE